MSDFKDKQSSVQGLLFFQTSALLGPSLLVTVPPVRVALSATWRRRQTVTLWPRVELIMPRGQTSTVCEYTPLLLPFPLFGKVGYLRYHRPSDYLESELHVIVKS